MNTQELKSYLKNALDLESAVLSCEQVLHLLNKRIATDSPFPGVPDPILPREPLHSDEYYHTPLPSAPQHPVKKQVFYQDPPKSTGFKRVIEAIVDDLSGFRYSAIRKRIAHKAYKKREAEAELDFKMALQDYHESMKKYRERIEPIRQRDELAFKRAKERWEKTSKQIQSNHNLYLKEATDAWIQADTRRKKHLCVQRDTILVKRNDLKDKLAKFYHYGPLYPKFQNMIAVAQLYDYIASGIALELEGPNGAYSQYMQDVRTERIRESIDTLRTEISSKFDEIIKIQYSMCNQLTEISGQLTIIDSAISDANYELVGIHNEIVSSNNYLSDMSSKLTALHEVTNTISKNTAHISQNTLDIKSSVSSISKATDAIALDTAMISFNQYIDMKSRGANAFLFS